MEIFMVILFALVIGYWNWRINHQKFLDRLSFYNKAMMEYAEGQLAEDTITMLRTINRIRDTLGIYEREQLDFALNRCEIEV